MAIPVVATFEIIYPALAVPPALSLNRTMSVAVNKDGNELIEDLCDRIGVPRNEARLGWRTNDDKKTAFQALLSEFDVRKMIKTVEEKRASPRRTRPVEVYVENRVVRIHPMCGYAA
jgi:hypothetical protein